MNEQADIESVAPASTVPPPFEALARWIGNRHEWEDRLVSSLTRNPLESLMGLLLGGSVLFYVAEVGINPKINRFWDALYYITTCASVGYADIVARTDAGKAISSVVFTFGPSLCARVFDRGTAPQPPLQDSLQSVVERLDAILSEMRRLQPAGR